MTKYFILFFTLSCAAPVTKYNRKAWKYPVDSDKNCINTRSEILKSRSTTSVTFNKKGCTVVAGKWDDYYYPETHTIAKKVDIDHLVPLKNAHETGGYRWTKKRRETFANDPENLVVTNLRYNRKKGAKGIDGWLPVHRDYACKYIKDWVKIKKKYNLEMTSKEQMTLNSSGCQNNASL